MCARRHGRPADRDGARGHADLPGAATALGGYRVRQRVPQRPAHHRVLLHHLRIPGLDAIFSRLDIDLPFFRFAVIALSLYTAAFVCEALRSGVNAVSAGQAEAARAIGLTFSQNMRYVVLPQAWKAAIVPLGSVIIAMIKNSALAGFFGLTGDLSNRGYDLVTAQSEPVIPVFIGIATFFLILTVPLGLLLDQVERRRALAVR